MRLLYAEDERSLARAVSTLLIKNNYSVDVVYDGESALDYLETGNYDGVILDIGNGLLEPQDVAVNEHSGFVERYLARGITVIHLLNVHALGGEGIPFDPVRPPEIGTSPVYYGGWR